MKMEHKSAPLHAGALGLAGGIIWGLAALILGLAAQNGGYGSEFVDLIGTVYIGYEATVAGAFIGLVWGFLDAFIGLFIFAWLYNLLARKCSKSAK